MDRTKIFQGSQQAIQPQQQDTAPRAANAGIGAGPRAYAPGATASYQGPRQRTDSAPPYPGAVMNGVTSPPPASVGGAGAQADPRLVQMYAQRLIDALKQRAQRQQAMRRY